LKEKEDKMSEKTAALKMKQRKTEL